MRKKTALEAVLETYGVMVRNSHIVYASGRHGTDYFNKDAIYPHTDITRMLCDQIGNSFSELKPEAVIGPIVGGVVLSQWTADRLSYLTWRKVLAVFADKETGDDGKEKLVIKRGYDKLIAGKKTLVVEDVLTTGGSVKQVVDLARLCGAEVIGVGALCNRGGVTREMIGDPPILDAIWNIDLKSYDADDCPLCRDGIPINTDVGKGRAFLASQHRST